MPANEPPELVKVEQVDRDAACPGHTASDDDPKVCRFCGIHADEERPDDDGF